ncbi:MAG: hypothetical protein HOM84_07375 [Thiotrichales bacterium]|jgi:cytochrome oxidase Cu insertion factor (SCO1/SenC/PrrC family)|nr:hypothetical protein [Thiotrichales bacterium]MBT3613786.1 hypothetical protein [Thiotrichales bacterium]MBT3753226.1 hypothetical protein [Thiotrichales bacterium]MBT3837869.1 hypothetical protein [Thiotrichales bacterium]MBT4152078.1 hypothetical protein [Thiotrichales bacterium]
MSGDSDSDNGGNSRKGSGAKQLLVLLTVFGLPMLGAWVLYLNPGLLPSSRSNLGELVQPVHPIPDQIFSTIDGGSFSRADLDGYWTLMLSEGDSCDEPCRKRIYDMRQIRKAMAENHGEIRRVVIFSSLSPATDFSKFMEQFGGTKVVVGDAQSVAPLREQFVPAGESSIGHLYIVDPMGNLMMHYLPEQPSKDVLSDMELLLKVNKWGGGH